MATTVNVPQWGMGITQGKVVKWLKREGESVQEGEPLVEVETAKATQEVEAPATGVLVRILAAEGAMVPVRETIGIIAEPGEAID
jgi:pyruvate/2-oxoglutarate dehydrogenase complex dihydrolipoamide acyltransferase (E2) component